MTQTQRSTVVGVFDNRQQAQQCVDALKRAGFRDDQIGVAARDASGTGQIRKPSEETYAEEGALAGALGGAGVGGLWAIGIAAGVLPAIGPVIVGGLLASLLASAATGAVAGGLLGSLLGLGVPEEEAKYYETEFHAGRTIVTVKADTRYDEACSIVKRFGAYDMSTRPATTAATAATAAGGQTVRLHEEQLHAHKHPVQAGEVSVRKEVHTEHKTMEVPVQREEVVIERRPMHGEHVSSAEIKPGEEIRIPVSEEQVHVHKDTVAKEEVRIGKRQVQDTETVTGTVRKEELKVEEKGDVKIKGDAGTTKRNPKR